jgi:hypothetical protein
VNLADIALDTLASGVLGFVAGDIRRGFKTRKNPPPPAGEICKGCTHAYSFHGKDEGPCGYRKTEPQAIRKIHTDKNEKVIRDRYGEIEYDNVKTEVAVFTCTCQRYDGRIPMPEYFAD